MTNPLSKSLCPYMSGLPSDDDATHLRPLIGDPSSMVSLVIERFGSVDNEVLPFRHDMSTGVCRNDRCISRFH